MNKASMQRRGRPATDLLEESVRLLRRASATAMLAYFIGAIPCMLGVLYFTADMSRSAFASGRLFQSAFGMAFLYLWMKCWQVVFAARLKSELLLTEPPQWTPSRVVRMVASQIAVQPTGLILRPAAMVLALPTVWTATFYQNITVLGDGEEASLWQVIRRAYAQCRLWPGQAHVGATLLSVFGFFVWLNICITMALAPQLLKMFFGVETVFSQHLAGLLNPTFFAASFAGLYLCINPVMKAFAVLRCFHGNSLRTGADLEVQLKQMQQARPSDLVAHAPRVLAEAPRLSPPSRTTLPIAKSAALLLILFSTLTPSPASAAMKSEPKVSAQDLNHSLDDVIERREYSWRAPRDRKPLPEAQESMASSAAKNFFRWLDRMFWKIGQWLKPLFEKLRGDGKASPGSHDWLSMLGSVRFLFIVLLVLAAVLLIVLVMRLRKRIPVSEAEAEPMAPHPDLNLEHVTADQLPEDGWLQLASDLIQRGELRLALRASYLASLAHLGHREFIRLARYKSNRDYDRELQRRARSQPELLAAFEGNLDAFERAWYGEHPVSTETLGHFSENLQTIRTC